jgi:2-methylcitrate dehydratase PrpD
MAWATRTAKAFTRINSIPRWRWQSEWLIAKSYFKLHPIGRYAHSAIDALEDLLTQVPGGRLAPDDIAHVEVKAYMLAASLNGKNIVSSFGARFSVPFALASILYHGRSGLKSFDEAAVANPTVQALVQRVDVKEEPAFTARYPQEQPVAARITLKNGALYEGRCTITKGEPANPHTSADLTGKFFELGVAVWGESTTQRLYQQLMKLEELPDMRALADEIIS